MGTLEGKTKGSMKRANFGSSNPQRIVAWVSMGALVGIEGGRWGIRRRRVRIGLDVPPSLFGANLLLGVFAQSARGSPCEGIMKNFQSIQSTR